MRKRFLIALILLLFLSTYNIQNSITLNTAPKIKKIFIENNLIIQEEEIRKKLSFLYESNIFFLNLQKIKRELNEIDFIKSFEIKKIYPDKIKFKIIEKEPVAILQNKKTKKFYTKENETISFVDLDRFSKLPLVFGDKESFKIFYNQLKKINFPINDIKKFYLYKSERWDLVTIKNQTIKLPIKNYEDSLKNFLSLQNNTNFEKYKIFDYRINGQLILK